MTDWTLDPQFLAGSASRLYALHVVPTLQDRSPREAVLLLPPFAEEMNRSRRMLNLQMRAFARIGLGSLLLDLSGTGDSDGSFEDASWSQWIDDVDTAARWLLAQGYQTVSLLGLRLGACLALAAAPRLGEAVGRLVLWQPLLRGQMLVNQFLRIRVAAGMSETNTTKKETVKELRQELESGRILEIAGYHLGQPLVAALDTLNLGDLASKAARSLYWIEVSAASETRFGPANQSEIERLAAQGLTVEAKVITGEAFWSIEEPALIPNLWEETCALWPQATS